MYDALKVRKPHYTLAVCWLYECTFLAELTMLGQLPLRWKTKPHTCNFWLDKFTVLADLKFWLSMPSLCIVFHILVAAFSDSKQRQMTFEHTLHFHYAVLSLARIKYMTKLRKAIMMEKTDSRIEKQNCETNWELKEHTRTYFWCIIYILYDILRGQQKNADLKVLDKKVRSSPFVLKTILHSK